MSQPVSLGRSRLVLVGLWCIVVCLGMGFLANYENRPGAVNAAPAQWPTSSPIPRTTGLPQLVMFAHPRCPCTRASIGELSRIMARNQGRVSTHVLFLQPDGTAWGETDTWRAAAAIPGVRTIRDESGVEARRFGAATSGHTLLYDGSGRLLFSGGITGSRGHQGDNVGRSTVMSQLAGDAPDGLTQCSVFGCPLFRETRD